MKDQTSATSMAPVVKRRARASRRDMLGSEELASIGNHLAQALHEDSPNINVGSSETVCVRYALVNKKSEYCGHRRSNLGGGSTSVFGAFEHARIWAREADAARYREQRRYSHVEIVPITCAVGRPYAIFTEAP